MKKKKTGKKHRLVLSTEERLRRDLIFINNPVLVEGLALAPVIATAVTLRNAVMFSAVVPIVLIPTRFLGNLFIGYIPQRLRAMIYAIIACLFYVPGFIVLTGLFGVRTVNLGIYLPMIVVDSIIISRTEIPQRESVFESFVNGARTSFGFAFAIVLVSAVREILGFGRLWDYEIFNFAPFPVIATAAGGFVVVACVCALFQNLISFTKRIIYRGAKANE